MLADIAAVLAKLPEYAPAPMQAPLEKASAEGPK